MAGLMSLDDRVMHLPSDIHGMAQCGEVMRDPWQCGPLPDIADKAESACLKCFADRSDWGSRVAPWWEWTRRHL